MKILTFLFALLTLSLQSYGENGMTRGERLVRTMGCNDCHSPGYAMTEGNLPKSQWLFGSPVGFMGPWGTSYPTNLRQRIYSLSEQDWVTYAQNLKTRPPMPYYDLKRASVDDLKAIYRFIRSLGDSKNIVPTALPPGEIPKTPYIDFNVKNMPL